MLHFAPTEYAARQDAARRAMAKRGLDGLLMFSQESMYYLTGYDTFGYCFFQCLYLGADGALILLTRAPDLRQAQQTSVIDDIRVWPDAADADPVAALEDTLIEQGARGARIGVEYDSNGLNAANGRRLDAGLDSLCRLEDASDLVTALRMVKSPAELAFVRCAAELADAAWDAALGAAAPGAFEGEVLAAMQGAVFRGGGDYPGNAFIIGSRDKARLCRYASGFRRLELGDQITLEWAGAYRHYHSCLMRTLCVGADMSASQSAKFAAARDALLACEAELRPGRAAGDVFAAHARTLDGAGFANQRMHACGYGLGALFGPSWMDKPMFYRDNPAPIREGMTVFVHIIVFDDAAAEAMTLGRTSIVAKAGPEPLSRMSLNPVAAV